MKEKRPYTRLPRDLALDVVRQYHAGEATQTALADRYGLSPGYVNRLVHGEARPDVYAQVQSEESAASA